ncbi:MAG: hypothetical protein R3A80_09775 [Bdellovibrionota bacterium]
MFKRKPFVERVGLFLDLILMWKVLCVGDEKSPRFEWRPRVLIKGCLDALVQRGILIQEKVLFEKLKKEFPLVEISQNDKGTEIRWTLLHSDRPEELHSFLTELTRLSERSHLKVKLFVLDDSRKPENTEAASLAVEEALTSGFKGEVKFFDREARLKACDMLAKKSGLTLDLFRFAMGLDEPQLNSTGGQRNFSLLLNAGTIFTSSDSDALPQFYAHKRIPNDVFMKIDKNIDEHVYLELHPAFSTILEKVEEQKLDFADQLGSVGKSLPEALSPSIEKESIDITRFTKNDTEQKYFSKQNSVKLKLWGLIGDSGSNERLSHFYVSPRILKKYFSSVEAFQQLSRSRQVMKLYPGNLITRSFRFMSTFFTLDNRELSPCFFPYYRGSDSSFGASLYSFNPHAFVEYDKHMVAHTPSTLRVRPQIAVMPYSFFEPIQLITYIATQTRNAKEFAVQFKESMLKKRDETLNLLSMQLKTEEFREISGLSALLKNEKEYPSLWVSEANQAISRLTEQTRKPYLFAHKDLWELVGRDRIKAEAKNTEQMLKFADLNMHWEDIFAVAKTIRSELEALGTKLGTHYSEHDQGMPAFENPLSDLSAP